VNCPVPACQAPAAGRAVRRRWGLSCPWCHRGCRDTGGKRIITGGENVYGPEIESVLSACPGVSEAVIIGIPDERWGEAVKAVVLPAPGAKLSADDVIAFCRARLAHYQPDLGRLRGRAATRRDRQGAQARLARALWAGRERAI
jgi:hypothetical protein